MRVLLKALAVIVAVAAIGGTAAYFHAKRSLPVLNGTIQVPGLSAPVDIIRDGDAIPHIFASTKLDGLYGLGYVHAQDRLWQMEFQRRLGFGRLSEVLGAATLPQDRFLRTVGFGRAARAAWARLPTAIKSEVEAYAAGVNAFLAAHHGSALPPEFTLLRFEPEPWSGPDVVVWQKMVAWDLSANYSLELLRHDILAKVGPGRLAELMPPYAADGLSILSALATAGATQTQTRLATESLSHRGARRGAAEAADQTWTPTDERRSTEFRSFVDWCPCLTIRPALQADRVERVVLLDTLRDSVTPWQIPVASPPGDGLWHTALISSLFQDLPGVRDFLLGGSTTEALGSNNWVVDGTMTASGSPLLANDPHLDARVPSIWYLAHVSAADYEAIGASFPGTPVIILGRNRFIAWGATNVGADVEDLYREKLDDSGRFTEFRGEQEALQFIPETIGIKGRPAVRVDVRVSRHGPLVSDAINANNASSSARARRALPPLEPLALRWTALDADDTTLVAMMRMSEARNWAGFRTALRDFVVPSQNFLYADVAGHIGYYAPGRIPMRWSGDGRLPLVGWSGESEWDGWVPFDRLPHVYDPPEHAIVTANQRPMPAGYPYALGLDWPESYRAQRITELLRGRTKLTPNDFAAIQADTLSLHARTLLPVLLAHARPEEAAVAQALRMLREWNHDARGDSAAAAIFEAWFLELAPAILADNLGQLTLETYHGRFSFVTRFLLRTLGSGGSPTRDGLHRTATSPWCDDTRTLEPESCDIVVTKALGNAISDLSRQLGRDMTRWRWDAVHRARFPHQGLDRVPGLHSLLSRSVPSAGDWSTIDVGAVSTESPYDQLAVASYRQIIDLSPANDSRFIDAVGQSGHPLSRHYDDFLPDWAAVKHKPMRMERAEIELGAIGRLRLVPR